MESKLTDAELVEKVAREVMGWDKGPNFFNPITDANDLQMVKDKLREMGWKVKIIIWPRGNVLVNLEPFSNNGDFIEVAAETEAHAICEAALQAERG